MDPMVGPFPSGQGGRIRLPGPFHEHGNPLPHARPAQVQGLSVEQRLEAVEAFMPDGIRHRVRQRSGRSPRPWTIEKEEGLIEPHIPNQIKRVFKVPIGFAGKAHNEIRGQGEIGPGRAQTSDLGSVLERRIPPFHGRENPVGSALDRQMQVGGQFRLLPEGPDEAVTQLDRVGCRKSDPLDGIDGRGIVDEIGEITPDSPPVRLIGVHVLPEKGDLPHTGFCERPDLRQNVGEGPVRLLPPGIGNDAKTAVLAAALHDRHEGARTRPTRGGKGIEFLNGGKANVHLRPSRSLPFAQEGRQALQGLGSEHHIDKRSPCEERWAFLARDTATHRNSETGVIRLEQSPPAQAGERLVEGLFPDGTGIEDEQIGPLRPVGREVTFCFSKNFEHLARIVDVHLASLRLDVHPFRLPAPRCGHGPF